VVCRQWGGDAGAGDDRKKVRKRFFFEKKAPRPGKQKTFDLWPLAAPPAMLNSTIAAVERPWLAGRLA
jgi:hypothetical protein